MTQATDFQALYDAVTTMSNHISAASSFSTLSAIITTDQNNLKAATGNNVCIATGQLSNDAHSLLSITNLITNPNDGSPLAAAIYDVNHFSGYLDTALSICPAQISGPSGSDTYFARITAGYANNFPADITAMTSAVNAALAAFLPLDQTAVSNAAKAVALDSLTGLKGQNVQADALDLINLMTSAMQSTNNGDQFIIIEGIIKSAVQLVADTVAASAAGPTAAGAQISALQAQLAAVQAQLGGYTNVVSGKLPIDLSDLLCCGGGGLLKMYNNMTMNIHPVEVTASLNTVVTINEIYNVDHGTTTFSNTTQTCTGQQNCAAEQV